MRVSELSRRTGVSIHRLRRWESAGLLRATRDDHGVRVFDEDAVRVVTFIAMGRDLEFGLDLLSRLVPDYAANRLGIDVVVGHLQARVEQIDDQLADLVRQQDRIRDHIAWFDARRATTEENAHDPSANR